MHALMSSPCQDETAPRRRRKRGRLGRSVFRRRHGRYTVDCSAKRHVVRATYIVGRFCVENVNSGSTVTAVVDTRCHVLRISFIQKL